METAIIVGLIALFGPILGFAASFVLQAWQRRWALDDQRRKWIRGKWEEFSKPYNGMAELAGKIYIGGQVTQEDRIELRDYLSNNIISLPPYSDSKLFKLQEKFFGAFTEFYKYTGKDQGKDERLEILFKDVADAGTDFMDRINTLIEETYK